MAFLIASAAVQSCIANRYELSSKIFANETQLKEVGFNLTNLRQLLINPTTPQQAADLAQRQQLLSSTMAQLEQEGQTLKSLLSIEQTRQEDQTKAVKTGMDLCFKGIG
jgi:hypothetical protein